MKEGEYKFYLAYLITICITIVFIISIMARCDKNREQEHTKQKLGGVTNVEHMDFP